MAYAGSVEVTPEPTFGVRLGRLRIAIDEAFQQSSRALGLTPQQAELLCAAVAGTSVGDLATTLHCDRSNISRLVDRAAAQDLVRRRSSQDDGRISLIALTPKGRRLSTRFVEDLDLRTRSLFEGWSPRRQSTAANILDEISAALEASCSPGQPT